MGTETRYRWCYYCEEASPKDDVFWGVFCPMCGNGNSLPGDFIAWERFRLAHQSCPLLPASGVRYSLTNDQLRQEIEEAQHKQFT